MVEGFNESDFGNSTKRRLPICFCLDTSGSMMGTPIKQLNIGLTNFISSIKSNDDTRSATDIAIVTFGQKVEIVMPFGKISRDNPFPACARSLLKRGLFLQNQYCTDHTASFRTAERQLLFGPLTCKDGPPWESCLCIREELLNHIYRIRRCRSRCC